MKIKYPQEELVWEKYADNSHAILKDVRIPLKHAGLGIKKIASRKMTDIFIISGEFGGKTLVFEPWISLLIDSKSSLRFYSVYTMAYEKEQNSPNLCIRRSHWDQRKDYDGFENAKDRLKYLLSEKQLTVETCFVQIEDHQKITRLVEEIIKMNLEGLSLRKCKRTSSYLELRCEIFHHLLAWSAAFSYHPPAFANNLFESWVRRWQRCFEKIDFHSGFMPDGRIRVSYKPSFFEYLEKFDLASGK